MSLDSSTILHIATCLFLTILTMLSLSLISYLIVIKKEQKKFEERLKRRLFHEEYDQKHN